MFLHDLFILHLTYTLYNNQKGVSIIPKIKTKISSGLYIPHDLLKKAGIDGEVELDLADGEIRIISPLKGKKKRDSRKASFSECIGSFDTPGIHGRDHDTYLYCK
jgi:hypothetical protein